jgi:hypothetical protein
VKAENALTIGTTTATPVGTYPISLTLTSGSFVRKFAVSLVVEAGAGFSLTPESTAVVVARGATAPFRIAVGTTGGFNAALTFAVNGLPTGVRAAYELSATAVTLKFTSAASAPLGTFPLTVVAVSGTMSATTAVDVVVSYTVVCAPGRVRPSSSPASADFGGRDHELGENGGAHG